MRVSQAGGLGDTDAAVAVSIGKNFSTDRMPQLVKKINLQCGDPSLIPGSGRSTGEGVSYPLQYSWASLVASW